MILINALAALTGVFIIWTGATGRLTTIVNQDGREIASNVGNALAIGGGICVVVSAVVG